MLVGEMRKKIKTIYGSTMRGKRVDDMPDKQVMAIFYRMQENGIFRKNKKKLQNNHHQIDLAECFGIDLR